MFCPNCGANVASGTFCTSCGTPMAPADPPPIPQGPPIPQPAPPLPYGGAPGYPPGGYAGGIAMNYADWGTRVLGYIIDGVLVGVVMIPLYFIMGAALLGVAGGLSSLGGNSDAANAAGSGICCLFLLLFPVATLLVGLYNSVYLVSKRGFTIGQGVVKVKVVTANGGLLTTGNAFLRLLVRVVFQFVPILPLLDLLWPLWDVRRQTLHDKAVNSYVITNPSGQ